VLAEGAPSKTGRLPYEGQIIDLDVIGHQLREPILSSHSPAATVFTSGLRIRACGA
jgi:hypothetical protein